MPKVIDISVQNGHNVPGGAKQNMARPKEFNEAKALKAAQELFWEQGYQASSLTQLTERMGIQRTSLYGTFGDKKQLFLAALDQYRNQAIRDLSAALQGEASPRGAIEGVLRHHITSACAGNAQKGCFCVNEMVELAPHDAEVAKRLKEHNRLVEQMLFETIERGKRQGEMPSLADSRAAARFLTNTLIGLQVALRTNPEVSFIKDAVEMTSRLLD